MKAFLDTSVLIATFYGDHEHHEPSIALFVSLNRRSGSCAAHTLAEVYASLTGMPGKYRTSPQEALLFLGNVRERLSVISLAEPDYFAALESAAADHIAGGSVYDALLAHCALRSGAETIYTWNVKHFKRLAPEVARRVATP